MDQAFHPASPPLDDYSYVRNNSLWHQKGCCGYEDVLKRGAARPVDGRTVLAELYSPTTPDFLHGGGGGDLPFLVSERARHVLEERELRGFSFAPVVIAKIATQGKRIGKTRGGEPEDLILKSRGVAITNPPRLFAVYVSGRVDVLPDYASGRHPSGYVSPFEIMTSTGLPDLWRPAWQDNTPWAWVFCSNTFRLACLDAGLSNIEFTSFQEFMVRFRRDLQRNR